MATIFASIAHLAVQESDFPLDCTPPGQNEVVESVSDEPKPCCMSTRPSLKPFQITGSGTLEYKCETNSCVSSSKEEKMYLFNGVELSRIECCDSDTSGVSCVGYPISVLENGTQIEEPYSYSSACQCPNKED